MVLHHRKEHHRAITCVHPKGVETAKKRGHCGTNIDSPFLKMLEKYQLCIVALSLNYGIWWPLLRLFATWSMGKVVKTLVKNYSGTAT